jgi:hypothetical protein
MTNAFGQRISESFQPVMAEYERWIKDTSDDKDIRPLRRAAAQHFATMGSRLPIPEFAPCLAVLYFAACEFESGWCTRAALRLSAWFFRVVVYRGYPMWNDFYICLWQLSRDPTYVCRLYWHLKRGTVMQQNTGAWMVGSVCQQDQDFDAVWDAMVQVEGRVFGGPISI